MKRDVTECNGVEQSPSTLLSSTLILSESSEEVELINQENAFDKMRVVCEKVTGLTANGEAGVKTIMELVSSGCTEADIRAGLGWITDQGKTLRSLDKILGPAKVEMQKRVQKANGSNGHKPGAGPGMWRTGPDGERVWFPE